jgi:hypothetical protein
MWGQYHVGNRMQLRRIRAVYRLRRCDFAMQNHTPHQSASLTASPQGEALGVPMPVQLYAKSQFGAEQEKLLTSPQIFDILTMRLRVVMYVEAFCSLFAYFNKKLYIIGGNHYGNQTLCPVGTDQ